MVNFFIIFVIIIMVDIRFEKSPLINKKYRAYVDIGGVGNPKIVDFGSAYHKHYRDQTGLGLWSHFDHGDDKRRENYRKRHGKIMNKTEGKLAHKVKFSPSWFSWHYLW